MSVQLAFDGLGSMPMRRIKEVREVKQVAVEGEMKQRANREQLRRSMSITRVANAQSSPTNGKRLPEVLLPVPTVII